MCTLLAVGGTNQHWHPRQAMQPHMQHIVLQWVLTPFWEKPNSLLVVLQHRGKTHTFINIKARHPFMSRALFPPWSTFDGYWPTQTGNQRFSLEDVLTCSCSNLGMAKCFHPLGYPVILFPIHSLWGQNKLFLLYIPGIMRDNRPNQWKVCICVYSSNIVRKKIDI